MLSKFIGLTLTDASETGMYFHQWRSLMNGVGVNSNMELIDAAMESMNTAVNGKADGFTLDPDTGILQLTTGGQPIDGASVTINLNKYYTKDEVGQFIDDLEKSIQSSKEECNQLIIDLEKVLSLPARKFRPSLNLFEPKYLR